MICNQCGNDYLGDTCPNCDPQHTATPETDPVSPPQAAGVHSDTVKPLFTQAPNPTTEPPQDQPVRFCVRCGAELHGAFCAQCGFRTVAAQTQPQNPNSASPNNWSQSTGHQAPSYSAPQAPPNPAYTQHAAPFTQHYQDWQRRPNATPQKVSPWIVVLLVFFVLFMIILPAISSFYFANHLTEITENMIRGFDGAYSENFLPDDEKTQNGNGSLDDAVDEGDPVLPNGVSIKEYKQVRMGMSYAEVSYIIGGDAMAQETSEEQPDALIALWPGEYRPDAVIKITFENDAVTAMEQTGLN